MISQTNDISFLSVQGTCDTLPPYLYTVVPWISEQPAQESGVKSSPLTHIGITSLQKDMINSPPPNQTEKVTYWKTFSNSLCITYPHMLDVPMRTTNNQLEHTLDVPPLKAAIAISPVCFRSQLQPASMLGMYWNADSNMALIPKAHVSWSIDCLYRCGYELSIGSSAGYHSIKVS